MNTRHALTPAAANPEWGFFGALADHAETAWPLALTAIAEATGQPLESARLFLDSRHGRHFADDVLNQRRQGAALPEAVAAAIQQWMGWRIGVLTSLDTGIPAGLPYLTGFVMACEIDAEANA